MDITGATYHDDSGYPDSVRSILQRLGAWLKNPAQDDQPLVALHRVLQTMAAEKPYEGPRHTGRNDAWFRPKGDDGLKYRRPVWEAIATQIDKVNAGGIPLPSLEAKAEWLSSQLRICIKLRQYESAFGRFQDELAKLELVVHLNASEWAEPDVVVTGSFKPRAEAAVKTVSSIVEGSLSVLIDMNKQKSA